MARKTIRKKYAVETKVAEIKARANDKGDTFEMKFSQLCFSPEQKMDLLGMMNDKADVRLTIERLADPQSQFGFGERKPNENDD